MSDFWAFINVDSMELVACHLGTLEHAKACFKEETPVKYVVDTNNGIAPCEFIVLVYSTNLLRVLGR